MSGLAKILKAAKEAQSRKRSLETPFVAPRTSEQTALAKIWATVLGVDAIGVDDGFFDLGGNSLQLTTVGAKIVSTFGVDLPLSVLFEKLTLGAMAEAVRAAQTSLAGQPAAAVRALTASAREGREAPATFAQEYYFHLYAPNHVRFLEAVRIDGALQVDALERALSAVVGRHEILRTALELRPDGLVQIVGEAEPVTVIMGEAATETELREVMRRELDRTIDVARDPLFEAHLVKLSETSHALLLAVAHVILDDWSLDIVFKELLQLYGEAVQGKETSLAPVTLHYRDFAFWQESVQRSAASERFWSDQLRGAEAVELPRDRERAPRARSRQQTRALTLPAELGSALRGVSKSLGASTFMTLLAAFDVFLHAITKQTVFVVRAPFANREPPETASIVGCFSHPLPFRADVSGDPTFREVLRRVRENVIAVHEHRPIPFGRIHADEGLWNEFDYRLNRVAFNLLLTDRSRSFGGMTGASLTSLTQMWRSVWRSYIDLYFYVAEKPAGMEAVVLYNEEMFDAARIDGFIATFQRVVTNVLATPDVPISETF